MKSLNLLSHYKIKKLLAAIFVAGILSYAVDQPAYSADDSSVKCKPEYTQIYQPPLKIGQAGRVKNIPVMNCDNEAKNDFVQADNVRFIKYESVPSGRKVKIYRRKGGEKLKTCLTPCEFSSEHTKRYYATTKLANGKKLALPAIAPRANIQGVVVTFNPESETETRLDIVEKQAVDMKAAISGGDISPSRFFPVIPHKGTKPGKCNVLFDVTPSGLATHIRTSDCANRGLIAPTVETAVLWEFTPKIVNGRPIGQTGGRKKITFQATRRR